jgi:hypothetical protein
MAAPLSANGGVYKTSVLFTAAAPRLATLGLAAAPVRAMLGPPCRRSATTMNADIDGKLDDRVARLRGQ